MFYKYAKKWVTAFYYKFIWYHCSQKSECKTFQIYLVALNCILFGGYVKNVCGTAKILGINIQKAYLPFICVCGFSKIWARKCSFGKSWQTNFFQCRGTAQQNPLQKTETGSTSTNICIRPKVPTPLPQQQDHNAAQSATYGCKKLCEYIRYNATLLGCFALKCQLSGWLPFDVSSRQHKRKFASLRKTNKLLCNVHC